MPKYAAEIDENNLGTYKNDYEDFCKGKINSFSDEDFKYLIKEYYPEEGIENWDLVKDIIAVFGEIFTRNKRRSS